MGLAGGVLALTVPHAVTASAAPAAIAAVISLRPMRMKPPYCYGSVETRPGCDPGRPRDHLPVSRVTQRPGGLKVGVPRDRPRGVAEAQVRLLLAAVRLADQV